MNTDTILFRLRRFLLALAGFLFVGTLVELAFTGHTKEPVQWIPFFLCGIGVVAVIAALVRPQRKTLLALRACMGMATLGSLFGVYEHITNNAAFYLEIHPHATSLQTIAAALSGANPLVAPGILAVAGMLAIAATCYHPALDSEVRMAVSALREIDVSRRVRR